MENLYNEEKKIALLIDADNIAYKYADIIFDELNKYGDIVIRRIYGDWTGNGCSNWKEVSQKYAMKLIMQESNTKGKNASDICLVIDAMKLLYGNKADIFCIVSSDSDFTLLAKEIRENGNTVIGMGEGKTPKAFVNACKKFVILDKICEDEIAVTDEKDNQSNITAKENLEATIIEIVADNDSKYKKTHLGEVGSRIMKKYPEFDVRNYGYSNFSALVRSLTSVKVVSEGKNLFLCLNSTEGNQIDYQIIQIVKANGGSMNLGRLGQELNARIPNLQSSIKATGVTKLSKYLKSIKGITISDNNVTII